MGGGYYQIKVRNSGKCLDINAASTADGGNAQIWTCNSGSYNQQWAISRVTSGGALKSAKLGPEELSLKGTEKNDALFYPNPFTSEANLKIENPEQVTSIVIIDMMGRQMEVVDQANVKNIQSIGSSLKAGIYMVQICGPNKTQTFKIIKNR